MTDSMLPNETLQSQLSAFVDDELPPAETDLFVRRLVKDAELKQAMGRYGLIGEALRSPTLKTHLSRDFSARIAAALEQQQETAAATPPAQVRGTQTARWLKPVAGLAVAASVAWASVLVVRNPAEIAQPGLTAETLQPVTLTTQRNATADSYVVPADTSAPSAAIPSARLTNYVVAHSEFSSPLGRHNVMTGLLAEEQLPAENMDSADSAAGR